MVKTTDVRGPTLARLATVSICTSCGKPSTWFPHRALVEWLLKKMRFQKSKEKIKIKNLKNKRITIKNNIFKNNLKISQNSRCRWQGREINIFIFY